MCLGKAESGQKPGSRWGELPETDARSAPGSSPNPQRGEEKSREGEDHERRGSWETTPSGGLKPAFKKTHRCFVSVLNFSYSFVSSRFFMQEAAQRREQKKIEKKQMKMKQIKVKAMWKRKSIQAHGESVLCSAFLPDTAIQLPQFLPEIFHQTLWLCRALLFVSPAAPFDEIKTQKTEQNPSTESLVGIKFVYVLNSFQMFVWKKPNDCF